MCRLERVLWDFSSRRSGESAPGGQTASPGALWRRAALELRRSWRALAQAPLWGEAGRGTASTSRSCPSPSRPKVPSGGCRKVRRGNGVLEGPGKSSGAQIGRPCCGIRGLGLNLKVGRFWTRSVWRLLILLLTQDV
ncbi:hypothetical protein NDU88_003390 [Pleurodeles waltl]|uniref:Uncharacterized protein n=1 Tax=Pleurodeles waltl TaxID=8319 RepID=A0AAV7NJ43_PLEWA|nr:hypothetical protein NDU88_003390 [Pleurodeles waltl]